MRVVALLNYTARAGRTLQEVWSELGVLPGEGLGMLLREGGLELSAEGTLFRPDYFIPPTISSRRDICTAARLSRPAPLVLGNNVDPCYTWLERDLAALVADGTVCVVAQRSIYYTDFGSGAVDADIRQLWHAHAPP